MLPKPADRFKPIAHRNALSVAVQRAWEVYQQSAFSEATRNEVAATIASHIESLYPPADLMVLRRYGFTDSTDHAAVRVFDGEDWKHSFGITLPRKVEMPRNAGTWYCGGKRFSQDPNRGIKPHARSAMSDSEWRELCEHQDREERLRIPAGCEPFFATLLEARQHYKSEYRQATEWPQETKKETGQFPTWEAIAARFPVLGEYLRSQWGAESLAA